MYHQLAVFTPPGNAFAVEETAKAIWRARGFELNADVYMHRQALIASLPMTLSERFHRDLKKMLHVTRKTMANAIHLAPLIAEWRGTRTPTLVFGGRRGQLMTLDLYDNDLGNYNFAIIDAPGSGKSVLMNEMAWSYRAIAPRSGCWTSDAHSRSCASKRKAPISNSGRISTFASIRSRACRTSTRTSTCWCRRSPRWRRCSTRSKRCSTRPSRR